MQEKYITVSSSGEAEIIEKKSRFIAHVKVIESEQDALAFIEETKKKYWDARHNCYAYQLGENHRIQRYNDDGEPGGTAGMPILEVLKGNDVHNTIIIVTRYFGGVLLGTGGLVRAYTKASIEGLKAAGLCEVVLYKEVIVTSDYSLSGKVQFEALQAGHIIDATEYTDSVTFHILCELPIAESFAEDIVNVTAGKADITFGEERYIKREIKEG